MSRNSHNDVSSNRKYNKKVKTFQVLDKDYIKKNKKKEYFGLENLFREENHRGKIHHEGNKLFHKLIHKILNFNFLI